MKSSRKSGQCLLIIDEDENLIIDEETNSNSDEDTNIIDEDTKETDDIQFSGRGRLITRPRYLDDYISH